MFCKGTNRKSNSDHTGSQKSHSAHEITNRPRICSCFTFCFLVSFLFSRGRIRNKNAYRTSKVFNELAPRKNTSRANGTGVFDFETTFRSRVGFPTTLRVHTTRIRSRISLFPQPHERFRGPCASMQLDAIECDSLNVSAWVFSVPECPMRLASSLGPFRRFNLAHPKLLILR